MQLPFLDTPCTPVSPGCTEWIRPAGQQSRVLIYPNYPLEAKNDNITRALVFVHGINRDADNHFRTVLAAAFRAGALNITIIVSPRFFWSALLSLAQAHALIRGTPTGPRRC